jgi:hypothetical protein
LKDKELLANWKNKTDEREEVVIKFLERNGFELVESKGSSHFTYRHPLLAEAFSHFPDYFTKDFWPAGELVVVVHKKRVKKWYLNNIRKALSIIEELQNFGID